MADSRESVVGVASIGGAGTVDATRSSSEAASFSCCFKDSAAPTEVCLFSTLAWVSVYVVLVLGSGDVGFEIVATGSAAGGVNITAWEKVSIHKKHAWL